MWPCAVADFSQSGDLRPPEYFASCSTAKGLRYGNVIAFNWAEVGNAKRIAASDGRHADTGADAGFGCGPRGRGGGPPVLWRLVEHTFGASSTRRLCHVRLSS